MTLFLSLLATIFFMTPHASALSLKFNFIDSSYCNAAVKNQFCRNYQRSLVPWSEQKKEVVLHNQPSPSLLQFEKLERRLEQAGVKELNFATSLEGDAHAESYYSFDTKSAFIILRPNFFNSLTVYKTGVTEKTHVLIHEQVHIWVKASVGEGYSLSPFWQSLSRSLGWDDPNKIHPFINTKERSRLVQLRNQLVKENKMKEANDIEDSFVRPKGFPSLYSMTKLGEFFPELIAYLVEDKSFERALSPDLKLWLVKNNFADLLIDQNIPPPMDYIENPFANLSFDFVGLLYVDNKPRCSISILTHGLLVTAKHCLTDVKNLLSLGGSPTYLKVIFPYSNNKILIGGLDFKHVEFDQGNNDFLFIHYPAQLTEEHIYLPPIHWKTSLDGSHNNSLLLASYRLPDQIRQLKMQVQTCSTTDELKEISSVLPEYLGLLQGTTCDAYYLSSGAPFYQITQAGELSFMGVLSHTFSIDSQGQLNQLSLSQDHWGTKSNGVFSRSSDSVYLNNLVSSSTSELSKNQRLLLQALAQQLRRYHALKSAGADKTTLDSERVRIQIRINLLASQKLSDYQMMLTLFDLLEAKEQNEILIEDELFESSGPLSHDDLFSLLSLISKPI